MRLVSDGRLVVTVPNHWRRDDGSDALRISSEDGMARLAIDVDPRFPAATIVRSATDLMDRLRAVASGYGFGTGQDEVCDDRPRMIAAATFLHDGFCFRLWELVHGARLVSALLMCPEDCPEPYLSEAEEIVRSVSGAEPYEGSRGLGVIVVLTALALMLVSDAGAFVWLLAAGDLVQFFGLLMVLWLVWAPSMALGWLFSSGRCRAVGVVLSTLGFLGATLWIGGPAVLLLIVFVSALDQDPLVAVPVGFACLVVQGMHFAFAAGAAANLIAASAWLFRARPSDV